VALIDPNGTTTAARECATVYVCVTCRSATASPDEPRPGENPGAILADAAARAAAGTGVIVKRIRCLANCTRGPSAALRCAGSWTYIFGGLGVDHAPALIDGARMLAGAGDGILPWRGRPDILKRGLIARVPPIAFEEDQS
jgi:predicted metal-binding protein